jgi:hypothetical protein
MKKHFDEIENGVEKSSEPQQFKAVVKTTIT